MPSMYPGYSQYAGIGTAYPVAASYPNISTNGYIQVAGLEGAQAYHLGPNSRVPAFDTNSDVFYDISTDANGNKSVTPYSFARMEMPEHDTEYATKKDLDILNSKIDKLLEAWNGEQSVSEA